MVHYEHTITLIGYFASSYSASYDSDGSDSNTFSRQPVHVHDTMVVTMVNAYFCSQHIDTHGKYMWPVRLLTEKNRRHRAGEYQGVA